MVASAFWFVGVEVTAFEEKRTTEYEDAGDFALIAVTSRAVKSFSTAKSPSKIDSDPSITRAISTSLFESTQTLSDGIRVVGLEVVGAAVGEAVAKAVGIAVGSAVGNSVRTPVDNGVGHIVGACVGTDVGEALGPIVGCTIGHMVGADVGTELGL
jgi:hypothetical protein